MWSVWEKLMIDSRIAAIVILIIIIITVWIWLDAYKTDYGLKEE